MRMRGRYPAGLEVVERLDGAPKAKERLRVILETLTGTWRVQEACHRLGICEQRFRQWRDDRLQAALNRLEDRPAGRPRQPEESDETVALRQHVAAHQRELQVAGVREEIALALPQVNQTASDQTASPAPKKKRRPKR
jgi:hypothetical protein